MDAPVRALDVPLMTKKPKSTAQKRAREMQAETGLPYHTCLNQARAEQEQRAAEAEHAAPEFPSPTGRDGLFSHA